MRKTLGDRVRLLREAKGWRQDELAQKVGLNREALSSIENNHRQIKAEELNRFADIFEVSCDRLLGRISKAKEDRRVAFGLQGKESKYICKKYAQEALNSWLRKFLISIVTVPAAFWFCIQIYEYAKGKLKKKKNPFVYKSVEFEGNFLQVKEELWRPVNII